MGFLSFSDITPVLVVTSESHTLQKNLLLVTAIR